jgi:hypothetical protein
LQTIDLANNTAAGTLTWNGKDAYWTYTSLPNGSVSATPHDFIPDRTIRFDSTNTTLISPTPGTGSQYHLTIEGFARASNPSDAFYGPWFNVDLYGDTGTAVTMGVGFTSHPYNPTNFDTALSSGTVSGSLGCKLQVQRWNQGYKDRITGALFTGGGPWGFERYDNHKHRTDITDHDDIQQWGCALTCLATAFKFAGVTVLPGGAVLNPGTLNAFMMRADQRGDFAPSGGVRFATTTPNVSSGLMWVNLDTSITSERLKEILCQGFPVIVRVTNAKGGKHYVLVTGSTEDGHFLISDPGHSDAAHKTLDVYGNQFEARGYVKPVRSLSNTANAYYSRSAARWLDADIADNRSALNFSVGDDADILVIDEAGRRTGFDSATQQILEEIPNSAYYRDSIADDDTEGPDIAFDHSINISQPAPGKYRVIVSGGKQGEYELLVNSFTEDGNAQLPFSASGIASIGSTSQYEIQFTPTPPPILLAEVNSTRAMALDSVTLVRDPFSIFTTQNFSPDHRTRLVLLVLNGDLFAGENVSAVIAQIEDAQHAVYPMPVEYIGKVPGFIWLTQIVVKLPDQMSDTGDALVSINLHGVASNKVVIKMKSAAAISP